MLEHTLLKSNHSLIDIIKQWSIGKKAKLDQKYNISKFYDLIYNIKTKVDQIRKIMK